VVASELADCVRFDSPRFSPAIGEGADANPLLTDAAVCDFVAFQQAQGWTGAGAFACP
jgi:hypothetical protein